jgi:hypothetical protein
MDFNWCHGPSCHQKSTIDRIRGSKGSKVLRTRKIKETQYNKNSVWSVFCSQGCYTDFFYKHWQQVIAIAPRREALETSIEDPTRVKHESKYHTWYDTKIVKR